MPKGASLRNTLVRFGEVENSELANRGRFPSLFSFYLTAVGAAVGFGNVWRFPALAKDYGGGAFFVPYVLALMLLGVPLLTLEVAIGQYYQTGNAGSFASFHKFGRGIGLASVFCNFFLITYYTVLLGWVVRSFCDSFTESGEIWTEQETTGEEAIEYFQQDIVGMSTLGENLLPTRLVGENVACSLFAWCVVAASIGFGIKNTGYITYITMGLPVLFLMIFLVNSVSLEGSAQGIIEYIGRWNMSVLRERPDVWSTAATQVFFSLSLNLGAMTNYASHCPRGEAAFHNSIVVSVCNAMFSFVSGFAVFAALGHLAYLQGVNVNDLPFSGFSLVFGTWPLVFGKLKNGIHWVRLLFVDLFLLAIDSVFVFDSPITTILDSALNKGSFNKTSMTFLLCAGAFLMGLIFTTDAGLFFMDVVDFYLNFLLLLLGFFQSFAAGWLFGIDYQIERLGGPLVFSYMITNFGPIILASTVWFFIDADNVMWLGFMCLFVSYGAGMMVTVYLMAQRMQEEPDVWTWSSLLYEVTFRNVFDLKDQLTTVIGYLPGVWALLLKQFIPHVLLILFMNLAAASTSEGKSMFGNYSGYEGFPYQFVGIVFFSLVSMVIVIGFVCPDLLASFDNSRYPHIRMTPIKEPIGSRHRSQTDKQEAESLM